MRIETGRICLGIPTELPVARLWWLLSAMSATEIDFVLQFAEEVAAQNDNDEPDDDKVESTSIDFAVV